MKKHFFILLLFALVSNAFAQRAWTVGTVPNTRLQSNVIHVSDPDGYLSDSAEMTINTALCAIRDTADVFLVTLSSIGEAEPKPFATDLFNRWGIGDAGKDNGVLLLFVEDQHALEFETGYGAEATLTDARCERIFTKTIVPYFRQGDYEGGLCAGVAAIVDVYGGQLPDGLITFLPKQSDGENFESDSEFDDMSIITVVVFLMIVIMPIVGLVYWAKKRKENTIKPETLKTHEEDGAIYIENSKTTWSGSPWEGYGCAGGLMIGLSIFVFFLVAFVFIGMRFPEMEEKDMFTWASAVALVLYLTWMCFRQGRRVMRVADGLAAKSVNPEGVYKAAAGHSANKIAFWMAPWLGWYYRRKLNDRIAQSEDCQCPTCHARMKRYSGYHLPEVHEFESRIRSKSYKPYRCSNGHVYVLQEEGSKYNIYSGCSACSAYAVKKTHTETVREADYKHKGEKVETYECEHCGHTFTKTVVIPMLVHYYSGDSYSSGSSSSRSYSSSSSHSSGSFGGGHSGGGGFSGRW